MGSCVGSHRRRERANSGIEAGDGNTNQAVILGKNQPLKHERLKWKSEVPLTDGQLRSKRDEFWDTAPAFEGRKEIWDALKAAAQAAENQDYGLAQAIIDGANISLPNGTLTDCYDELGNRYQLPIYCLTAPANMGDEHGGENEVGTDLEVLSSGGAEAVIKVRLSLTSKDLKLTVRTADTILVAKRRLQVSTNIPPTHQRWFYGGKLLNDKTRIEDVKIPPGYVVQVVVMPDQPLPIVS